MILIISILLILKPFHTYCSVSDVNYLPSNNLSSLHTDCDLSFDLSLAGVGVDLSPILLSNILYWIHSHIFTLIDSSFVYDIDEYADDFWSEYYLHLITISNETITGNTVHLSIDICGTQTEVLQIIRAEVTKDGEEIAAYVRYKLFNYVQTYDNNITIDSLHVYMMIVHVISSTQPPLFVSDATSHSYTKEPSVSSIQSRADNDDESTSEAPFVFTENMFYVAIIGFFMLITAMIVTVLCVLCIKQVTDKRLERAIKEIGSHNNRNTTDKNGKSLGTTDMTSIEPIPIPNHLASIDTGLNPKNILEEIDDQSSDSSITLQRNKLGLKSDTHSKSKRHILSDTESHMSEMEQLNASPILIDDILSSSPSSMLNTVFMEDPECRRLPLQSMSARLSNHLSRSKKEDMNIVYNPLPQRRSMQKDPKHTYAKRHSVHSMVGKQYAKRKESNTNKRSVRSQSKPNLRIKNKRSKPKLMHNSYSQKDVSPHHRHKRKRKRHNGRYSLQIEAAASYNHNSNHFVANNKHYSVFSPNSLGNDSVGSLAAMNKKKSNNSLSVQSNHNRMMLYEHKESVDVDAIEFDNGKIKINMNKFDNDKALKALDPPIPNPQHMGNNMVHNWDTESESSVVYNTNTTTKGTPDGVHHSVNVVDAHSNDNRSISASSKSNVYKAFTQQKIAFSNRHNETPPPPPPPMLPPPPAMELMDREHKMPPISLQSSVQSSNHSQTVLIRMTSNNEGQEADDHEDEEEDDKEDSVDGYDEDTKCRTLSLVAVQSNALPYYQPNL